MSAAPKTKERCIRIIGIGNDYRSDDAAGLLVARTIRDLHLPDVDVLEVSAGADGLLEAMHGAETAILIDAVSSGSVPGTTFCVDARNEDIRREIFCTSTHAVGIRETVQLSKVLGLLPQQCWIYGIEGKDFHQGTALSKNVKRAIDVLAEEIAQKVESMIHCPVAGL